MSGSLYKSTAKEGVDSGWKNTLVIGATTEGGIGQAFSRKYSEYGRQRICFVPDMNALDVSDEESIDAFFAQNGPFDEIVYAAGVSQLKWLKDLTQKDINSVLAVNTVGIMLVAGSHVGLYPDHPTRIAVVCSDASGTPMRGSSSYCVSKAAAEMAVKCIARELAPTVVTVGVSPGVVADTPMTNAMDEDVPEFRNWSKAQARSYADSSLVMGRRVTAEEVADTIFFALTGPETLNGSIITINGGK